MSRGFRQRVALAVADRSAVQAVRRTTRQKSGARAAAMEALGGVDELCALAGDIKQHTLNHLSQYLEQFTARVEEAGGRLHAASDAAAAREIICRIAREHGCQQAVKVKSMTTEEVGLNAALAAVGVHVSETDLGEFIVQLDGDRPSHITAPIIHKDRRRIARAISRKLHAECPAEPEAMAEVARKHLRGIFRTCDLGISGANFAIAETGTICICTNEGNGRMSTTRPRVHVVLMGIEKLIPRMSDLPVFLKLLSRSTTGQPLGSYTSLITGPRRAADPDGPESLHVVLLDGRRSEILAGPYAEVLRCVRCGACLNICPVYRSIGGHAYDSVYPGPIGSVLMPLLDAGGDHAELPYASTLCGACSDVCPVRIDLPGLLVRLRRELRSTRPWYRRAALCVWHWLMRSSRGYSLARRWKLGLREGGVTRRARCTRR